MKDFFYAIQDLFVDVLFWPFDVLRELEFTSWFGANIVSWIFIILTFSAFIYWMLQLRSFDNNNEEDKSITAHTYL